MSDAETDALIEAACQTPHGRLKASYVLDDLNKIAPAFAHPELRPAAEAVLTQWQDSADPLRKGIATAWLSRARTALAPRVAGALAGAGKARGAVSRGFRQAESKAGDIGAAAGEKLARSPLGAKSMGAARQAGGEAAQSRMAQRLAPNPRFAPKNQGPRFLDDAPAGRQQLEAHSSPRMEPRQEQPRFLDAGQGHRNFSHEQAMARGGPPKPVAERSTAAHADALSSAFRAGAAHAADAHAGAAARHGRVAARHAFKAGLALAGAGAAAGGVAAGASAMSRPDHVQKDAGGAGDDEALAKGWKGAAAGAGIGLVTAGPIGALVGGAIGHHLGEEHGKRKKEAETIPAAIPDAPKRESAPGMAPHVARMAALNAPKKPRGLGKSADEEGELAKGNAFPAAKKELLLDEDAGKAPQGGLFAKDRNTKSGVGEDAEMRMPTDTEDKITPVAPHVAALAGMLKKKKELSKSDDFMGEALAKAASERDRAYAHFAGAGGPEHGDPDITSSAELLGGKDLVLGGDKAVPSKPMAGEAPHVTKLRQMHDKYKKA